MSNTTFIYCLVDPFTKEIRYVGKSNQPKIRLRRHIRNAKEGQKSHKSNWIRTLLDKKSKPILKFLEEVNQLDWEEKERFWIRKLRDAGFDLTNTCIGGLGGYIGEDGSKNRTITRLKQNENLGVSKYKGVSKAGAVWRVDFTFNRTRYYLGVFRNEEEAARAYDYAIKRIVNQKHLYFNFPEDPLLKELQYTPDWKPSVINNFKKGSKYRGVSPFEGSRKNKWKARIRSDIIGYFETEIEAALAYNKAAVKIFGDSAILNVIEDEIL